MMPSPDLITLVIADDHPIILKGLREVIEEDPGIRILGEANDGRAAYALIEQLRPTVAVLDIEMPELSGLEVVRLIGEHELPVLVIILTMYDDEAIFSRALDLGVRGYILKDSASMDIVRGIRQVAGNEYYISPSLSGKALRSARVPPMDYPDKPVITRGQFLLSPGDQFRVSLDSFLVRRHKLPSHGTSHFPREAVFDALPEGIRRGNNDKAFEGGFRAWEVGSVKWPVRFMRDTELDWMGGVTAVEAI